MSLFGTNTRIRDTNKEMQQISDVAGDQPNKINALLQRILSQGAGKGDIDTFRQGAGEQVSQMRDPEGFSYDWDAAVSKFLDPTVDAQTKSATKSIEGSAANRGGLFSSDTGRAIADRSGEIAKQAQLQALQMASADKGQAQNLWSTNQQLRQGADQSKINSHFSRLNNLGQLAGFGQNALMTQAGAGANALQSSFDTQNQLALQRAMNNLGKKSWFEDLLGAGSQVVDIVGKVKG